MLDLEGNDVSDLNQLDNLDFSHNLRSLNISNNKIDSNTTQKLVLEKLQKLELLNDLTREEALSKINSKDNDKKQTEKKFNIGCLRNLC